MTQTRSGRIIKKPDRYVPVERVEDDFDSDDYDSDESELTSEIEYSDEELDEDSESDDSFVVPDDEVKSEIGEDDNGDDDESDDALSDTSSTKSRAGRGARPTTKTGAPVQNAGNPLASTTSTTSGAPL